MESASTLVYCDGDMISSSKGIMFECPSDPKVITIGKDMSLAILMKTIINANGGCRILINLFYCQPIYKGDGSVEYNYMKLKLDDDVGIILFIYSKFSSKCLIELNATFRHSPHEIFALLHKPRKPRTLDEIIDMMLDEFV